jgi:hypothetical protein
MEGTGPRADLKQLALDTDACPECAMQLQLHMNIMTKSIGELEDMVAPNMLETMWPRVKAKTVAQRANRLSLPGRLFGNYRLVWSFAAVTLLLCITCGMLLREVRTLQKDEMILTQQLTELDRRLSRLAFAEAEDPVVRIAQLAGKAVWERALEFREHMSISELKIALGRLPANTTLFEAQAVEALAEISPFWPATVVGAALSEIDSSDGVQAAELLQAITEMDIRPRKRIDTARILSVIGGGTGVDPS